MHLADDMSHIAAALTKLAKENPDLRMGKRPLLLRKAIRLLDRLRDDLESGQATGLSQQWVSFAVPPLHAKTIEDLLCWSGVSIGSRNRSEQLVAALATSTAATEYSPASGVGLIEQTANTFGLDALPAKHRRRLEKPPTPFSSPSTDPT